MIRLSIVVATVALTAVAAPAFAQGPAECKPVSAAMTKLFTIDHSNTTTSNGTTNQGITAGGVMYIQVKGAWRKSPMTLQAMQKQEEENIRNAKAYSCRALPDDSVAWTASAVYMVHSETEAGASDAKIWVAKSTGLPLKTEEDLSAAGQKFHMSIAYGYTNIHAPVVK